MTALPLLVAQLGCGSGDGLQRVVISGSVNYLAKPVKEGQLRFVPAAGTAGPVTIAPVRDGRYLADNFGGVPVGEHRVEILAYDLSKVGGSWPTGPGSPPPPQLIPAKYNTRSELHASVQPTAEPLTMDFNLTR